MPHTTRSLPRLAGLLASLVLLTGCEAEFKEGTIFRLEDVISGVSDASGSVHATLNRGALPTGSGATTVNATGIAVMINGGSSVQSLTGSTTFNRVVIGVDGLDGWYDLTLPGTASSADIILNASTLASSGTVTVRYGVGDAGATGPAASQSIRFLQVGSGDIQISVSWTDSADVDLHVIDPAGEEIFFGHKASASGGTLDLDANAACSPNESSPARVFYSNENVVWPVGQAPNGTYRVVLDYWSDCGVAQTDWVATVQRQGAAPQIFTGTFTGLSSGVPDDTVTVFTF
jgi:hypothetical protein